MEDAYNTFVAVESTLGRPITYEEVLALVAFHEFGIHHKNGILTDEEYQVALEAMGRQFYSSNFCGSNGLCTGDGMWRFLGSQQGWYGNNGTSLAMELINGEVPAINFKGAQHILSQPYYNPEIDYTDEQKMENWRSGSSVAGVPYVYGNYSMLEGKYGISRYDLAVDYPDGINGNALDTIYMNIPDANPSNGNGYLVMTLGQECTINPQCNN